ncbi:MAG: helix-turn-helix domain-containing protein [Rhodopseudomonas palustris]|nr:helix-turn-helix domain-containing protein [Rhodopseudomonas palustris]
MTNCRVVRSPVASICQSGEPCRCPSGADRHAVAGGDHEPGKDGVARIAAFLLRIRRHLPTDPKRPHALVMMIPRADIADRVGTSLETVCRALAEFKAKGLIDMPNRKTITYLNLPGLIRIAGD